MSCKWLLADSCYLKVISSRIVHKALKMEGSYSVATNNRFAFFMDDEDDPGDMMVGQNESKTTKPNNEVLATQKKTEKVVPKGNKEQRPTVQGKKGQGEPGKRREVQCELLCL